MTTKSDSKRKQKGSGNPQRTKGALKDLDPKRAASQVRGGIPPKTTSSNGGGDA